MIKLDVWLAATATTQSEAILENPCINPGYSLIVQEAFQNTSLLLWELLNINF